MMKPDTIDSPIYKPDTIDSPVYDKPNTYDDDEVENHDSEYREPIPQEVLDDLIVRAEFINGKRPDVKTNDDDDGHEPITNTILSQISPPTVSYSDIPEPPTTPSPSTSSVCSDTSTASSASRLALLQVLKKKPMEDMISFDLRKTSLTRPHQIDIYFKGTKKQAYRKVQPHSYSWGFQNVLYRTNPDQYNTQYAKVAEARRRAFQKEITLEWGDFPLPEDAKGEPLEEDDFQENGSVIKVHGTQEDEERGGGIKTTFSNKMTNRTNSHLLFTYHTEFEDYRLRWKRASLLSHDMTCELKHKEDQYNPLKKSSWRVIAEFDSHRMGYFIHLGELIMDKNALSLSERPDLFEAHLIVTCCTLIDLMREVVEKAVGLGKGGVAGSD